nr:DNA cytosine methyltransferase [Roseibium sp. RKSG952]
MRNLIAENLIAPGDVDDRSIVDVRPSDLAGYTQSHFFAGIGVWSYALRLAGWPDDRPVWTGSCPCQPFSAAGKGSGFDDERHLWPHWFHLVSECQPPEILGEQVASKDGLTWLDLVQADLEGAGYACGFVDTCSAGVGAPHIRQRLRFWAQGVEHSELPAKSRQRPISWQALCEQKAARLTRNGLAHELDGNSGDAGVLCEQTVDPDTKKGAVDGLADAECNRQHRREHVGPSGRHEPADGGTAGGLAEPDSNGCSQGRASAEATRHGHSADANGGIGHNHPPGPVNGFWRDADWLSCRDGKWRPVRPGSFPLVDGAASRVGRLRAYGNAVDAQATKVFIEAVMECRP